MQSAIREGGVGSWGGPRPWSRCTAWHGRCLELSLGASLCFWGRFGALQAHFLVLAGISGLCCLVCNTGPASQLHRPV